MQYLIGGIVVVVFVTVMFFQNNSKLEAQAQLKEKTEKLDDINEMNKWLVSNKLDVNSATAIRLWNNEKQRRNDFAAYRAK